MQLDQWNLIYKANNNSPHPFISPMYFAHKFYIVTSIVLSDILEIEKEGVLNPENIDSKYENYMQEILE